MHKIFWRSAFASLIGIAAGCSGGTTDYNGSPSPPPPPPPAAQANDINIVPGASTKGAAAFSPNPKSVSLSGAQAADVRWVNGDVTSSSNYGNVAVTHHIVSDDGTSFDTGDLGGNTTSTKSLAVGTYGFHCQIHPSMTGSLVVSQ
jgi:plastocyanin